jgi:hypothetical protein
MSIYEVLIVDGPQKAALQKVAASDNGTRRVSFETDAGPLQAQIDTCDDLGDNASEMVISGHVASGTFAGRAFLGTYDPGTRQGSLNLMAGS